MQNININNDKSLTVKILRDEYFDCMLYKGDIIDSRLSDYKSDVHIDVNSFKDEKLYSHTIWDNAVNGGVELNDIGFTGVDNGFIHYEKSRITNREFLNLFTGSTYNIDENDLRLFLTPVTGNTGEYTYEKEIIDDYIALKGGFYQGFFKLEGFNYQVLPKSIEEGWSLFFRIRRRDYETNKNTLNETHPLNKGIFFYMGTRSENKFWRYYSTNPELIKKYKDTYFEDEYYDGGDKCSVINCDYLAEEEAKEKESNCGCQQQKQKHSCKHKPVEFSVKTFGFYDYDDTSFCDSKPKPCGYDSCKSLLPINWYGEPGCECACGCYEEDSPINWDGDDGICEPCDQSRSIDAEYIEEDVKILTNDFETSDGIKTDTDNYYEIETDNKFITFDRTGKGFTVDTWDKDAKVILTGQTKQNVNLFPYMDRTPTGYTINDVEELAKQLKKSYSPVTDIKNNCFALIIKEDGSIGYRYCVSDCDKEERYSILEEYSYPDTVNKDEWSDIGVKILPLQENKGVHSDKGLMKLYFYVNKKLVFISKELPVFKFKALTEAYQKQEGVPYNISLGGGTIGLMESIYPNYYERMEEQWPVEKYFAGTFIGDIKEFRFYSEPVELRKY